MAFAFLVFYESSVLEDRIRCESIQRKFEPNSGNPSVNKLCRKVFVLIPCWPHESVCQMGTYLNAKLGRYESHVRHVDTGKTLKKERPDDKLSKGDAIVQTKRICRPVLGLWKKTRRKRLRPRNALGKSRHQFKCKSGEASCQCLLCCGIRSVCPSADLVWKTWEGGRRIQFTYIRKNVRTVHSHGVFRLCVSETTCKKKKTAIVA